MNQKTLLMIGAGLALYYFFGKQSAGPGSFQFCQFPDGTQIKIPLGSSCPYDASHGGQSIFLATTTG